MGGVLKEDACFIGAVAHIGIHTQINTAAYCFAYSQNGINIALYPMMANLKLDGDRPF